MNEHVKEACIEVGRAELGGLLQQRGRLRAGVLQLALHAEQRSSQRLQVSSGSRACVGGASQQLVRLLQGLVQLRVANTNTTLTCTILICKQGCQQVGFGFGFGVLCTSRSMRC